MENEKTKREKIKKMRRERGRKRIEGKGEYNKSE